MHRRREDHKTGLRTCYNCYSYGTCKLLELPGISYADMFNKCPDIKMKEKPPKRKVK